MWGYEDLEVEVELDAVNVLVVVLKAAAVVAAVDVAVAVVAAAVVEVTVDAVESAEGEESPIMAEVQSIVPLKQYTLWYYIFEDIYRDVL